MPKFTWTGDYRHVFPGVTAPGGGTLALEPGGTVELDDYPGIPGLVDENGQIVEGGAEQAAAQEAYEKEPDGPPSEPEAAPETEQQTVEELEAKVEELEHEVAAQPEAEATEPVPAAPAAPPATA